MSRKRKELPLLEKVLITDVAAEGKAIARVNDLVVFVPHVVPGDVVDLQVRRKKHHYAEAEAVKFHKYSDVRAVPFCQHFGICGGCVWQILPYSEQLKYKQKQVVDALTRIGKVELPEITPIIGSEKTQCYRNKLEFTFSNKRWLTREEVASGVDFERNAVGFHITGAFDKILPIEKCWLMDDLHNQIRNEIYRFAVENGLSFFDLRQQVGLLRDVIFRNSASGELMVIFQFHYDETGGEEEAKALMQHIADQFSQITSLLYLNNQKCNDTIGDQEILTFKGTDYIFELMEDLKFKVGPKSFYQTNTEQAYHLYSVAREFAGLTGGEVVYDLYTGTGTIAQFVASSCKKVVGIEYVKEAIDDAKINAALNGIANAEFFTGDMAEVLNDEFVECHGTPDVVITDPPRAGMHEKVVKQLLAVAPRKIVYVSCNPATQARDLKLLSDKYRVARIQPVDMFPHTQHVENVAELVAKN